ncbi:hypothetical protein NKG94_25630 [Micromonospora sp. M12]
MGADPDGSALVGNTTTGVAVVLQSVGLHAGDEVLSTDHGYGAVSLAIQRECRRTGAVSRVLPIPPATTDEQIVQTIRAGLRPGGPGCSWSTSSPRPPPGSSRPPPSSGGPRTRRAGPGGRGTRPGMLPTPVANIGADFWVGNLHKWAYAPRGPPCWRWHRSGGTGSSRWWSPGSRTPAFRLGSSGRRLSTTRRGLPPRRACSRCAASASTGCARTTPLAAYGQRVVGTLSGDSRRSARPRRAGCRCAAFRCRPVWAPPPRPRGRCRPGSASASRPRWR